MTNPRVTLFGAAGEVTGSCSLVEAGDRRMLVDLGLFQGTAEASRRNVDLPDVDLRWLDAVALTHVHVDHAGRLPMLMRSGWQGPVFCTHPTAALLRLTLHASSRLQVRRHHEWLQRQEDGLMGGNADEDNEPPAVLYTSAEVDALLDQLVPLHLDEASDLGAGVSLRLRQAGHILGAASVQIDTKDHRLVCSGDLGRADVPPIPSPVPCPSADLVMLESTYGSRPGSGLKDVEAALAQVLARAALRGGPIIVPTFAIGRTQQLLFLLGRLSRRGTLDMNVYLDSAMAVRATSMHAHFPSDLHADAQDHLDDALEFPELFRLTSRKAARRIDAVAGPAIIMAGNGFAEGGPILRHLARWLPDPEATVLLTGHCLAGTLVGHLATDPPFAFIDGRRVQVQAVIETLDAFGGHATASQLEQWLVHADVPGTVILNHGEEASRTALAAQLAEKVSTIHCPGIGEGVSL